MNDRYRWLPVSALALSLGGCDFVGDVFEVGFWVGLIFAVLILALVVWAIFQIFD